ncbi:hypothetical protein EPUS_00369 [Endocarpon pusillum Z07020]|uniref:Uncharacterized protein n=1 Tax=Endocarpon pusillum (strain Z07020 / HMAS-L-300199) TaxID=1263415 RepID=U1GEP0_ENDPU|nr:uncharacterized protein EPUS_00369 [Endocarpon pusillum Z07020]ERF70181.1 hypothetical protein EPUS_00369 [Endocarpon pusillum Z07020]
MAEIGLVAGVPSRELLHRMRKHKEPGIQADLQGILNHGDNHMHDIQPPPPTPKPADKPVVIAGRRGKLELEIQEATEKLSLFQKRRDEAARTKDHTLKSDLEYYAIPNMEARIEKLKQELNPWVDDYQQKRDDEKRTATASASANTEAEKGQISHNAELQTDSESSSEEDEPDESEADMDIYD